MSAFIRLHEGDGVVIARTTLMPGTELAPGVAAVERIPAGHKAAVRAHAPGEAVRRYGQVIGIATQPIAAGARVHTHNIGMGDYDHDYAWGVDSRPTPRANDAARVHGHPPAGRPGRDAQLHRHPDQRELLGPRGRAGGRRVPPQPVQPAPTRWRTSPTWTAWWR